VVGLGPHLAHGTETEGLDTVLDDHCDLVHGDSLPHQWQEINQHCHSCHWWQQCFGRRLTAMTTLLTILITAAVIGLLVNYARHDHFAGAALRADDHDELGPVEARRHLVPRPC
jgi:hypothetical protein